MILADELFAKDLQGFTTCLLLDNNLCGKLVSSSELPIKFDDSLKTTSVSFFIAYFNVLSCEFEHFCIESFYINKN